MPRWCPDGRFPYRRLAGFRRRPSPRARVPRVSSEPSARAKCCGCTEAFQASRAGSIPVARLEHIGEWRSLVAHPAGGRAVAGSNPVSPIITRRRTGRDGEGQQGHQTAAQRLALVIGDLRKRRETRPRTLKTLSSTISALFQKKLTEQEVGLLVDELQAQGVISISGSKVSYEIPAVVAQAAGADR